MAYAVAVMPFLWPNPSSTSQEFSCTPKPEVQGGHVNTRNQCPPVSHVRMLPMQPTASLRSGFAWTLAGNGVYALGQWALLSLFAKLGSRQMLGEYALALAVASPVAMLSHLNLRAVLATETAHRHSFGDYLSVRIAASALGLLAIAALSFTGRSAATIAAILAAGVALSAENVSDLYYGAMQRRERMDCIAKSMMARAIVSAAAVAIALIAAGTLVPAMIALAAARIAVLLLYDLPVGSRGERLARTGSPTQRAILRAALPLGVVLMLVSLNTNLPRYAIERRLGTPALGAFAAAASFMTAGNTIINALGQSATPRLARYFAEGGRARFLRLVWQLAALAVGIGFAGMAVASIAAAPLLRILYRPEFAQHATLLVQVMAAAIPAYVAATLGYAITSARAFDAQLPLFCIVVASCGIAAWLLVPRFGLAGAPIALGIAACVQIFGAAVILRRALHRAEPLW